MPDVDTYGRKKKHKKIDSISSTEYVNVINLLMHWKQKDRKKNQQTIVKLKIETHWEFRKMFFPFLWIIIPRSNWNNSMNRNQIPFIWHSTLDVENYCDSLNRCDRLVELFIWFSIESHIIWIDQMDQHKGDRFN